MNELTHILNACCKITGIPFNRAVKGKQDRDHVICRNLYFYFSKLKGYSYTKIGKLVNKDHSTVIHGFRNIKNFISINDKIYLNYIREIEKELAENDINLKRLELDIKLLNIENLKILRSKITDLINNN